MRRLPLSRFAVFPVLLCLATGIRAQSEPVTFGQLSPILQERCVLCHRGEAAPLGLRLESLEGLLAGSSNGPVVEAGNPDGSELIRRLRGESMPRMPMTGPPFLSETEIALFEAWVAGGLAEGGADTAVAETGPEPAAEAATVSPARPAPGEPVTWSHVAPIFATRCAKCHTDPGMMGPAPEGYRLTSYESILSAGDRVRVVPGRPEASELVRRIRGQALPRMPFDGPPFLDDEEIALIVAWIEQGARNTEGTPAGVPAGAKVRLHGILERRWWLDDLELTVTRGTRIDKNPRRGDYVQVRGRLDAEGDVRVERLRRR